MSAKIVIPPSPNWYACDTLDCHRATGAVAYAASRNFVIVSPTLHRGVGFPNVTIIPDAHNLKTTCVAWNQKLADKLILCTAGDDGAVKIWDTEAGNCVYQHQVHESQKVLSLSWSSASSAKHIASLGADGAVVVAELLFGDYCDATTKKLNLIKMPACTISLSPHTFWHLIIGCKGGLLYICDTRNSSVLHKLRGHEDDIFSLSWCPVDRHSLMWSGKGQLFTTTGRDRSLKIWSVSEGRCLATSILPKSSGSSRPGAPDRSLWLAVHWLEENEILTSGLAGELLSWAVGVKMSSKVVHKVHGRPVYNMGSFVNPAPQGVRMVWSCSQDRSLVLWPMDGAVARSVLGVSEAEMPWLNLPTLGGFVYAIEPSPIEASLVALGVGDASIRLWNTAADRPDMTVVWNGVKGKVTSLSWSPSHEGKLAFGTDEGRVGVLDTLASSKPPILSNFHHKGTIYRLGWAPAPSAPSEQQELVLYSCGGGVISTYDPWSCGAGAAALTLSSTNKGKGACRSDFKWNDDYTLLAVGGDDGAVEVYRRMAAGGLQMVVVIVAAKKMVQSLAWHPHFTLADEEPCELRSWLAVASNETSVKVFQVGQNDAGVWAGELKATLAGHKERVASVSWNPHRQGSLVSASYDGTCQVWNVLAGDGDRMESNFGGHLFKVFSCQWHGLEQDLVLSGGDDLTVRVWSVKDQLRTPAESLVVKNSAKDARRKAPAILSQVAPAESSKKKGPAKLKSLFPVSSALDARGRGQLLADCKVLAYLNKVTLKYAAPATPAEQMAVTVALNEIGQGGATNLGFFADGASARLMVGQEVVHHVAGSNLDLAAHMLLWLGDVEPVLREAVRLRKLSDFLVSLAPRVSLPFWQEMCGYYGQQLVLEGEVRKAVSYWMAAGRIDDAQDLLASEQLCRESVAVARCLDAEGSQGVVACLKRWAEKAAKEANYELAAKCYLAVGEWDEAGRVLARRADSHAVRLAADLVAFCGLDQLAEAYLAEANRIDAAQDGDGGSLANIGGGLSEETQAKDSALQDAGTGKVTEPVSRQGGEAQAEDSSVQEGGPGKVMEALAQQDSGWGLSIGSGVSGETLREEIQEAGCGVQDGAPNQVTRSNANDQEVELHVLNEEK